jgi:hypothetical protein
MIAAGIASGGLLIASVGAAASYYMEKNKPTVKSIMRDFIIGSVLVLMILQLLPDSIQQIANFIPNVSSFSSSDLVKEFTSTVVPSNDMEIQVGIPGF